MVFIRLCIPYMYDGSSYLRPLLNGRKFACSSPMPHFLSCWNSILVVVRSFLEKLFLTTPEFREMIKLADDGEY